MKVLKIRNLILFLALCVLGVACDDSSTGNNPDNSSKATFNGRVNNTNSGKTTDPSSSAVEGAVVTAAYIKADGSLETIGNNDAQTNAQGEYSLQVDVSAAADASDQIVIVADDGSQAAKTVVSSNVENGASYTVKPITFETTAEAEVYQQVVADGKQDEVSKADVEITVESDVAADIESNTQHASNVAAALESSAEARANFYSNEAANISEDQKNQIMQTKQEAAVEYESQLDAATSAQARKDAYNTFIETVANAELDAGVEAWAAAEANDFAANAMLKGSANLSNNAQTEIRHHIYYYTAVAVDAGAQAEAKAAGASDNTVNAIADAGATLRSDIQGMTNASEQAVADAFVKFNEDVQTAINNDASLNGSAFVSVNTAISGSSGLKNNLEQSLSATTDINTMMTAYSSFSSNVKSLVESSFTGASDAKIQAYTRLLVLLNVAS